MNTKEVIVNGKKVEIVMELDPEYEDLALLEENNEKTLDLTEMVENLNGTER